MADGPRLTLVKRVWKFGGKIKMKARSRDFIVG